MKEGFPPRDEPDPIEGAGLKRGPGEATEAGAGAGAPMIGGGADADCTDSLTPPGTIA